MEELVIRRAVPEDTDSLTKCIDAAYAHYADLLDDLPPVSAKCAESIRTNAVFVAEASHSIVGGIELVPSEGFVLLANVAVHPVHSGVGIGRQLLEFAEKESFERGYREMRLHTHAKLPEIIRFYTRRSWKLSDQQGTRVTMSKELLSARGGS